LRAQAIKDKMVSDAAMYFAEIGEVPSSFSRLRQIVPKGVPWCVQRHGWSKYFQSWGAFTTLVKRRHPELIELVKNAEEQYKPQNKDPLEALRASTTEK
jgi:hypothetical protein